VKVTAKLMGIVDTEVLEYHWGPNWLVWDAEPTDRQHGQHVEYTLQPEGGGTRVRFDITLVNRPGVSGHFVSELPTGWRGWV